MSEEFILHPLCFKPYVMIDGSLGICTGPYDHWGKHSMGWMSEEELREYGQRYADQYR